jgi:hypothetical protein
MKTLRLPRAYLLLAALTVAVFAFIRARNALVNDDGVLYLMLAQRIGDEGLRSVLAMYDRPFYPLLIASIHAVSGLSLSASAGCLDALLAIAMVCCFAQFCCLLYDDRRILPWAALVILAHPKVANYFGFVFRDVGYWTLLLASFCALMRYAASARVVWLVTWALCTLVAAAFRPDALVVGIVASTALVLAPRGSRVAALLRVPFAWLLLIGPVAATVLIIGFERGALDPPVRDALQIPVELWRGIPASFHSAAARYAQTVLNPYSHHAAAYSLAGGLLTILLVKALNTLGPLQCLLLGVAAWRGGLAPASPNRALYAAALLGSLLPAAAFIAYRQFLDTRYVMLACLLGLAPVARFLQQMAAASRTRGRGAFAAFVAAAVLVFGVDFALGLDKPKPYLVECANWLRDNLPADSRVFSNDRQLAWASRARWDWQTTFDADHLIAEHRVPLDGNTYWIIHIKRDQQPLARELQHYASVLSQLHRCGDPHGARVEVYAQEPAPGSNSP